MSTPLTVPQIAPPVANKRSPMAKLAAGLRLAAEAIEEMEPKPEAPKDSPMTAKAVGAGLGISAAEVYRQVRLGQMKALRIGKMVRIPVEEFEAFRRRRLTR